MRWARIKAALDASLNLKLIVGLLVSLLLVGVPFFAFFYTFHRDQLVEGLASSTSSLSRLVESSLEAAMLRKTPHQLQEDVSRLAERSEVERIMILDPNGEVRVSSDPRTVGTRFDREHDPTCQVCHSLDRAQRQGATIASSSSGEVFRTMTLILNQPRCHACHPEVDRVNGVLVMDISMASARQRLEAGMQRMLAMGGVMVLLTVGVLGFLTRKLVVDRLHKFTQVTALIREGRLGESVPVGPRDEIGRLAESFNIMTASLRSTLEELERQRRFLEDVVNSIRDEIVVFDRDGRIVTANQAGRERCERGGAFSPGLRQTIATAQSAKYIEIADTSDGGERHLEVHAYPLSDQGGSVHQVIQVARDITERKDLEAHLMHSERLASLGLLASGFSHEINNPLGTISVGIEGLLRKVERRPAAALDLAEMEEYLQLILKEVHRAKAITDRLLVLSRPTGGRATLIDVGHAVADTAKVLRYQAERLGVTFELTLGSESFLIKGDEPGFRQVLLNLMMNAIQAIDGSGTVSTEVRAAADGVEVAIRDTGRGIPAEDQKRIFEPFFSRRPVQRGTGLGLFISSAIVTRMGGRIDVRSQVGEGTEFTVFLPVPD